MEPKPITFRPTDDDARRLKLIFDDLGSDDPSSALRFALRTFELLKEQKEQERIQGIKQRNYEATLRSSHGAKMPSGVQFGPSFTAPAIKGPNDGVDVGKGGDIVIE